MIAEPPVGGAALVRPAKAGLFSGRKSHRGKCQKPRSLEDRLRETNDLKLFDEAVQGTVSESTGRNESEREMASKTCAPKAEPPSARRRQYGSVRPGGRTICFGGVVATACRQGQTEQLGRPSSPREEMTGEERPYNRRHREMGRRREGVGWAHSSEEGE